MKRVALVLLLTTLAPPAVAQTGKSPKKTPKTVAAISSITPPPMPLQVQAPTQTMRRYSRIVYVLDVSELYCRAPDPGFDL